MGIVHGDFPPEMCDVLSVLDYFDAWWLSVVWVADPSRNAEGCMDLDGCHNIIIVPGLLYSGCKRYTFFFAVQGNGVREKIRYIENL
jgi:hypothetical protein